MAEPLSIIMSAITVGMTAAHISKIFFSVADYFKSAKEEISDMAAELATVSQNLVMLGDILVFHQDKCKPLLFQQIQSIIGRFK
jgi:hypothetical protein